MTPSVKRAAVFGAGSMGSGIAAQFAKAGGFMHPARAELVEPGNVEDDLGRVAEADWIVEAVVEDLAIKHDLLARIDSVRKPDSVISSNTSTIPLARLIEGHSKADRKS